MSEWKQHWRSENGEPLCNLPKSVAALASCIERVTCKRCLKKIEKAKVPR